MHSDLQQRKEYAAVSGFSDRAAAFNMTDNIIKLPESELEIMQAIWALNAEGEKYVTAGLIMKRFPALNRLKLTTVLTLITRLQMKDFISVNKEGRSNCYTPIIPLEEYRKFALKDFIERVFTGDREALVSMLQKAE